MIKWPEKVWLGDMYGYTEDQLKQAVRDAYEDVLGIDWFELMRNNFDKERSEHIAESIETAIHALIKEI